MREEPGGGKYLAGFPGVIVGRVMKVAAFCVHVVLDTMACEGDSMANYAGVVQQLKKEHDRLTREIRGITAALAAFGAAYGKRSATRGRISAAGRARIAAAQRARWEKVRAKGGQKANVVSMPRKRMMSAAARKRIAAAQRARWARVKKGQSKATA